MTSASVLFCNRRSRIGRRGFVDLERKELDSSNNYLHRISHQNSLRRQRPPDHHHTTRRDHHRLDIDGCDSLPRRAPHLGHHLPRRFAISDGESASFDQARTQSDSANVTNPQNRSVRHERFGFLENERLPGAVLLARERLLQRLRGVSLSNNRQYNRDPLITLHDDLTSEDGGFRFPDAVGWESVILRDRLGGTFPPPDVLSLEKSNRPPALNKEALNCLQVEIFRKQVTHDGEMMSRVSQDCSICLDSFCEGDKLICLPCGHRFHHLCLCHWLQICGDCPYCRTGILLTTS